MFVLISKKHNSAIPYNILYTLLWLNSKHRRPLFGRLRYILFPAFTHLSFHPIYFCCKTLIHSLSQNIVKLVLTFLYFDVVISPRFRRLIDYFQGSFFELAKSKQIYNDDGRYSLMTSYNTAFNFTNICCNKKMQTVREHL